MRCIITLDEVSAVRDRMAQARVLAAERFRDAFTAGSVKPEAHLGIQAADVEQEAMLRLWRALRDERNVDDLASYIHRIAVTATIDAIRRVAARREEQLGADEDAAGPALPPADPRQSPDAIVARRRAMEGLMKALARLPANRRRCVELLKCCLTRPRKRATRSASRP